MTRTADNCVLGGAVPPWCISEDAADWTATSLESWGTGNFCKGSIPSSSVWLLGKGLAVWLIWHNSENKRCVKLVW